LQRGGWFARRPTAPWGWPWRWEWGRDAPRDSTAGGLGGAMVAGWGGGRPPGGGRRCRVPLVAAATAVLSSLAAYVFWRAYISVPAGAPPPRRARRSFVRALPVRRVRVAIRRPSGRTTVPLRASSPADHHPRRDHQGRCIAPPRPSRGRHRQQLVSPRRHHGQHRHLWPQHRPRRQWRAGEHDSNWRAGGRVPVHPAGRPAEFGAAHAQRALRQCHDPAGRTHLCGGDCAGQGVGLFVRGLRTSCVLVFGPCCSLCSFCLCAGLCLGWTVF